MKIKSKKIKIVIKFKLKYLLDDLLARPAICLWIRSCFHSGWTDQIFRKPGIESIKSVLENFKSNQSS